MTHLRGSRSAYRQFRYSNVRRSGQSPSGRLPLLGFRESSRRLFEAAKPWLFVTLFLLILGLAGGLEQGTVWP